MPTQAPAGNVAPVPGVPLQFVVGKGGVGKSTLSTALALASAGRGERTLLVEFGGAGGCARLLGVADAVPGRLSEVRPGLFLLVLRGDEALAEYLGKVLPVRRLLDAVLASRLYRVFVAGAPGLRELMTVGKVFSESGSTLPDGSRRWARIVVDAGASGHSLQYLQMPSAAVRAFGSGLVHREATRVQAVLADPQKTCVHVVATPEEMPVTEASSIVERLRGGLGLPIGSLVVNRCREAPPRGATDALRVLAELPLAGREDEVRGHMLRAARAAREWHRVQEAAVARLEQETGLAALRLPMLAREEFGLREVEKLAAALAQWEASGEFPAAAMAAGEARP